MSIDGRVSGKIAPVTGAAQGIGAAIAARGHLAGPYRDPMDA
jgi:NAD(P)-dependent dehydrogenase (short-subunit alcohol dehydrogenase family)